MALTVLDDTISSDRSPHTARVLSGRDQAWEVSWLPGRPLDRNSAITAMMLADITSSHEMNAGHHLWPHIEGWAAELDLTAPRTRNTSRTGSIPAPGTLVPAQATSPETTPPADRLAYSVDEAARLTGLSRDLLYDEMRRGNLNYLKIGRRRIITRQHLEQFLAITPTPQIPPGSGIEATDHAS